MNELAHLLFCEYEATQLRQWRQPSKIISWYGYPCHKKSRFWVVSGAKIPVKCSDMLNLKKNTHQLFVAITLFCVAGAGWLATRPYVPSLEDKIGQMLMIGFLGTKPEGKWAKRVAQQIADREVGGVVFLGHNFKTRKGATGLTKLFGGAINNPPPFIALDMEGGFVQRLGAKLGYEKIPPAQTIAETMSPQEAEKPFAKLALMTAEAGFNVNLGPVVDLLITPDNPVVAKWKRSYGTGPQIVFVYAQQFIAAHRAQGIMTVLKHFPGHGSSLSDSHEGFVDISKTWNEKELIPFQRLINSADAVAIMPGHLILHADSTVPVSLSKPDITGLLRKKLGFSGLVISDDMQMSAIRKNFSYDQALIKAINAVVDILMISNTAEPDLELPIKSMRIIKRAVRDDRITKTRIDTAYNRILAAKKKLRRQKM